MKMIKHSLIASAVLASALATFGCNATMFTQANDALKSVRTAGSAVGNARLPTAAIAASLAGMKMMEAMSSDGQEAKSAGIIAAGSGNIIAAGGGNYALTAFEPGKEITKEVKGDKIAGSVTYSSIVNGSRVESAIKSFTCESQGYSIEAKGSFTYDAKVTLTDEFAGAAGSGEVACTMSGTVKSKTTTIELSGLNFRTFDPMPKNAKTIGGFTLKVKEGDTEHKLAANIGVKDGQIVAEAESFINDKKNGEKVTFDQANPGGSMAGAADAGVDGANATDKK